MAENKKLTNEELDAVAGGINNVGMEGAQAGGNQTVYDEHTETTTVSGFGEYTKGDKTNIGGDSIGGNKSDVKSTIDTSVNVKKSLF
ncbi:MAG: hypothetical protein PHS82_05175 [Lachnospiraceae bacterium]|nr:hypothetical protein [Lachnospiraceae bacterium]